MHSLKWLVSGFLPQWAWLCSTLGLHLQELWNKRMRAVKWNLNGGPHGEVWWDQQVKHLYEKSLSKKTWARPAPHPQGSPILIFNIVHEVLDNLSGLELDHRWLPETQLLEYHPWGIKTVKGKLGPRACLKELKNWSESVIQSQSIEEPEWKY